MSLSSSVSENARWRAVQQRHKSAHSSFIYAVLTTRIFCRPTCPARLARRANIVFFDSAIDATNAGFRPCKRCKPMQHDFESEIQRATRTVSSVCEFIKAKQGNVLISEVAEHVGISVRHLYGLFKRIVGCSPAAYVLQVSGNRLETEIKHKTTTTANVDQVEAQIFLGLDYSSPSTYAGTEMWTWDSDEEFIALSEFCGSGMSPELLTPIYTGSPLNDDWMSITQFSGRTLDTQTVTMYMNELIDFNPDQTLAEE